MPTETIPVPRKTAELLLAALHTSAAALCTGDIDAEAEAIEMIEVVEPQLKALLAPPTSAMNSAAEEQQ